MNRTWMLVEPKDPKNEDWTAVEHFVTDEDIIRDYFPYWSEQMRNAGKEAQISHENCIDDYVVVHWAERVMIS